MMKVNKRQDLDSVDVMVPVSVDGDDEVISDQAAG
jgi:hypothetical protein